MNCCQLEAVRVLAPRRSRYLIMIGVVVAATLLVSSSLTTATHNNCVFPFVFKDKTYFSCTREGSKSTSPWCSLDRHFVGRWKLCDDIDIKVDARPTPSKDIQLLKQIDHRMSAIETQMKSLQKQLQRLAHQSMTSKEQLVEVVKNASYYPLRNISASLRELMALEQSHGKEQDSYKKRLLSLLENHVAVNRRITLIMSRLVELQVHKCDVNALLTCDPSTKDCPLESLAELISKHVAEKIMSQLEFSGLNPMLLQHKGARGG